MFGDTAVLAHRATELRTLAGDTRDRATRLTAPGSSTWVSTAAAKFAAALSDRARDFDTAATSLEDAASAIDAHIASVEETKRAIADAEKWVADRWNGAMRVAGNVAEVAEDGIGKVFHLFGQQVPDFLVHQSQDIVHTVTSLPDPGSPEWLNLSDTFRRRGW